MRVGSSGGARVSRPAGARSAPSRRETARDARRAFTKSSRRCPITRSFVRRPRRPPHRALARFAHRAGLEARAPPEALGSGVPPARRAERAGAAAKLRDDAWRAFHQVESAGALHAIHRSPTSATTASRSGALRAPGGPEARAPPEAYAPDRRDRRNPPRVRSVRPSSDSTRWDKRRRGRHITDHGTRRAVPRLWC